MITALFIAREDGDFDFAACFATIDETPSWIQELQQFFEDDGEEVLVRQFGSVSEIPDVLTV